MEGKKESYPRLNFTAIAKCKTGDAIKSAAG
jgi:hypothetical protein